jgi:hypothetical protein
MKFLLTILVFQLFSLTIQSIPAIHCAETFALEETFELEPFRLKTATTNSFVS